MIYDTAYSKKRGTLVKATERQDGYYEKHNYTTVRLGLENYGATTIEAVQAKISFDHG